MTKNNVLNEKKEMSAVDFSEIRSDQKMLHTTWCIVSAGENIPQFRIPIAKHGTPKSLKMVNYN